MSSWVEIRGDCDFSLDNVPFGVASFSRKPADNGISPRCCTAIGDYAVDLSLLAAVGLFREVEKRFESLHFSAVSTFCEVSTLNRFMSYPREIWVAVRERLIELFRLDNGEIRDNPSLRALALCPLTDVVMHLPCTIGDYTDFYSSRNHATNVGIMIRGKDNALQANWMHLPVGYHGRSSTIFVSGTDIKRPCGQLQKDRADPSLGSVFGPTNLLDFELEIAFFCGGPTTTKPPTISEARNRIFGYVLMNDWSARDIQKWEYVPLGPFGSKNFATTISPWIVTTMALEPFQCSPLECEDQVDPRPLDYLRDPSYATSSYDIQLSVGIQGEHMEKPATVCRSNYRYLYWNSRQQLVHHAVTGCIIRPGDLMGSGTISGTDATSLGSMLELSWMGSREVKLGDDADEARKFLKDGDTVVMEGYCSKENHGRVGFGQCTGKVLPVSLSPQDDAKIEELEEQKQHRFINLKLYNYWRSSCSWRVRIALAAKNLLYEYIPVHLLKGEQSLMCGMAQVPVLECHDTKTGQTLQISQSLAIIDFIEEAFPGGNSLLPSGIIQRTFARELAEIINSGTQPLSNLSLMQKIDVLTSEEGKGRILAEEAIEKGLYAMEAVITKRRQEMLSCPCVLGPFLCGTFSPTIADACAIPQMYGARRLGLDLNSICPTLVQVEQSCLNHPWFQVSHPEKQKDATV